MLPEITLTRCMKFQESLVKRAHPDFLVKEAQHLPTGTKCYVDVRNMKIARDLKTIDKPSFDDQGGFWLSPRTLYADIPLTEKALAQWQKKMEACGCKVHKAHDHSVGSVFFHHGHAECSPSAQRCVVRRALEKP